MRKDTRGYCTFKLLKHFRLFSLISCYGQPSLQVDILIFSFKDQSDVVLVN